MSQNDYPYRFSESMVSEIKAEMGRRDLSSRGLGRLIGKSSQYMSDRLDGGSSKTGERVPLNVRDLVAITHALGISTCELIERANAKSIQGLKPVESVRRFRDPKAEDSLAELKWVASKKQDDINEDDHQP